MKRIFIVLLVCGALLTTAPPLLHTVGAAPQRSQPASLDKTRFVFYLGTGYYAFHHFVYAKYRQGAFTRASGHRKANFVKAALALLFTYHAVQRSYSIARSSHNQALHALSTKVRRLSQAFQQAYLHFKFRNSTQDIASLNTVSSDFSKQSSLAGYAFHDIKTAVQGQ